MSRKLTVNGTVWLAMGLARLGAVIKYIPDPVIVGFTTGIGVIIWVGQWQSFFGLPAPDDGPFYLETWRLLGSFAQLHWPTTLLGLGSLALALYGPRVPGLAKVPGPLLAMVATMMGCAQQQAGAPPPVVGEQGGSGAMLAYEQKSWAARLNVKNIFDRVYYDAVYDQGGFAIPGTGRAIILTGEYKF